MKSRNQVVLVIAALLFLLVTVMEWMFPLNVRGILDLCCRFCWWPRCAIVDS